MGKRKSDNGSSNGSSNRNKKYKVSGFIDPNTCGVYATCNRGRELGCRKELVRLLSDKIEQLYPDWKESVEAEKDNEEKKGDEEDGEKKEEEGDDEKKKEVKEAKEEKELTVEEQVEQELQQMKKSRGSKSHPLLVPMELGCECLVFVKVKKPAMAVELVQSLCEEAYTSKQKNTRFTQKLSPIESSVSASEEELEKLAKLILKPHFHQENQKPLKFAIQVTRRNFNSLEKEDIIKKIASLVGNEHGHSVDLKNYDKLIMVECYKTNVGMAVVSDFQKYDKFNLQQIFENASKAEASELSRVR